MTESATGREIPAVDLLEITTLVINDVERLREDLLARLRDKMLAWECDPFTWYTFPGGFGFLKRRTRELLRRRIPGRFSLPEEFVDRYVFGSEGLSRLDWDLINAWEPSITSSWYMDHLRPREIRGAGKDLLVLAKRLQRICLNDDNKPYEGNVFISSNDWERLVWNNILNANG